MDIQEKRLIEIDGSYGEGGGQILRTALSLSAILRKPFTIHHIRSKRENPGLQAQHLEAVKALAQITEAQIEGVKFGSQKITFIPKNDSFWRLSIRGENSRFCDPSSSGDFPASLFSSWKVQVDLGRRYPCPMESVFSLFISSSIAHSEIDGS